jgi:hypothetical protein
MSTATLPWRADRNVTLVWIAMIWTFVLFGFGADVARFLHESPPPPLVLDLHGLFSVFWLGLVSTQVVLAETGKIRLHKELGWATIAVSAIMVPFGFVAAMVDMARQAVHPDYAPQFLGEEFQDIFAFTVCTIAGVITRKARIDHSRFMVLAAVALADVGPGRIASNLLNPTPTNPLEVWLIYYWGTALLLIAMLAWDLFKYRRVTGSVMFGAALLWGGEALASVLYFVPAWKTAMAGLVHAWGWMG